MITYIRVCTYVFSALALSACQTITKFGNTFEGQNDYRIVPLASIADRKEVPLVEFSRFQANTDKGSFFNEGDFLQLNLKTLHVNWFSEGAEQHVLNDIFRSPVKGEIAIVANVTQGARNPGGRNGSGELEGRVIYYGNDVYRGQLANEYNIPLFGPQRWNGGPVSIDIWVMELDEAESQEFGSVLTTLASLSQQALSLPVAGTDVLNQIGTAFLKSNQDDVIGHIGFTLAPPLADVVATDAILQQSDIVVSRATDRVTGVDWKNCTYYPREGDVKCGGSRPYNTMVLSVRRSPARIDLTTALTLSELNERLMKASSASSFQAVLTEVSDTQAKQAYFARHSSLVEKVKDQSTAAAVRSYYAEELARGLQCALLARRDLSSSEDRSDADRLCGERWRERALSIEDFDVIARGLLGLNGVDAGSFDRATLAPDDRSQWQTARNSFAVKVASASQLAEPQAAPVVAPAETVTAASTSN